MPLPHPSQSKPRLLLLSAGSLAAQNVIDALGARREHCVLIGTNSLPDAAGNFRCDRAWLAPPAASHAEYLARLIAVIKEEDPHLAVPTRDEDVVALAVLKERLRETHCTFLVGNTALARTWLDKAETARFAERHALPFSPTALTADEAIAFAHSYGLPLIGKPRAGNASRGVVLLRSIEEIRRAFNLRADLIAQPLLEPPPNVDELTAPFETGLPFFFSFPDNRQYVITVIVGPDGTLSPPFGWLCTLFGGQSTEGHRCDDPDLHDVALAYARAAASEGWRGPLNVQLKRAANGKLVAFELNGRFGGGTAARTCVGFDEVGDAIRRFVPECDFPRASLSAATRVQKYLRSNALPRSGVIALESQGRWTSSPAPAVAHTKESTTRLRILLLSVGSLAALKFLDALGDRRRRCVLIGTNSVAEAAGNFRCDTVHMVPRASDVDAYIECLRELIDMERPDIVIPARDEDVLALALLRERFAPLAPVLLTGSLAAARMLHDKLWTARFAERHGLAFAPTADNSEDALALAAAHGFPLIGKPRSGNATRGVVLLRTASETQRAFIAHPDLLAQPFLDPPADIDAIVAPFAAGLPLFFSFPETRQYFLQIVVGPDGELSQPFATLSTQFCGQAIRTQRCNDADLLQMACAYAAAAASEGWRGPLNVQLKRRADGKPVAHELNGRFSGGTAARAYLGFDEVGEVINRFVPDARFPSMAPAEADVVENYQFTCALPSEPLAILRARRRWSIESAS